MIEVFTGQREDVFVGYAFPPPALLPGGGREGTPVQIVAFMGTFFLVTFSALGISLLRRGQTAPFLNDKAPSGRPASARKNHGARPKGDSKLHQYRAVN